MCFRKDIRQRGWLPQRLKIEDFSVISYLLLLGRQPLPQPFSVVLEVPYPIVETIGPALPELDFFGDDEVAAPVFRHGDVAAFRVFLAQLGDVRFQGFQVHGPALRRGDGADLATVGAGFEVGAGGLGIHFTGAALHGDLAIHG